MMAENGNKNFLVALLVILGIFVGALLTSKQGSKPAMKELMIQQSETLKALKNLESGGTAGAPNSGLSAVLLTQQDLQKRVTALETKLDLVLENIDGGGQKAARPQGPPPEDYTTVHDLAPAHSPVRGNKDAPITIVEFVDFQCPFCARFHPPINEVLAKYPDKVKYMIKNFPLSFHPEAKPASKAAFAAGEQGKYFEMADAILKDNSGLNADKYLALAKELGLDLDKFNKDLKNNDAKYEKWIQEDIALGAKVSVRGTPTFYLNGQKTVSRSFDQYKKQIDDILSKGK